MCVCVCVEYPLCEYRLRNNIRYSHLSMHCILCLITLSFQTRDYCL